MTPGTAKRLAAALKKHAFADFATFTIEEVRDGSKPLKGFHPWADGRPLHAAIRVRYPDALVLWLLVIDWNKANEPYLVVMDGDTRHPFAEVHTESGNTLTWTYRPAKRDGKNDQRRGIFKSALGSPDAIIPLPASREDTGAFLDAVAQLTRFRLAADALMSVAPAEMVDGFPEGREFERRHRDRERSSEVVRLAKLRALEAGEGLACRVCSFDFEKHYGEHGAGFIEAHHTVPVCDLPKSGGKTDIQDLVLVCSNCHRMLHRRRPWLTVPQLGSLLAKA